MDRNIELQIIEMYLNPEIEISEIKRQFKINNFTYLRKILVRNNIPRRTKFWTEEEVLWLKENYPKHGSEYCAEHLNKARKSIISKAYKLKIEFVKFKPTKKGHKICCKCLIEKPLSDFSPYLKKRPKPRMSYDGPCKICHNKEHRDERRSNPEIHNAYLRAYNKKMRLLNPNVKIRNNLRSRLSSLLRYAGTRKFKSTFEFIGCDVKTVKKYLESLFKSGMSWNNYGSIWHIDHIMPCHTFDLTILKEQEKCFHYTNLRPLWATTEIARQFGDFESVGNLNRSRKNISPPIPL